MSTDSGVRPSKAWIAWAVINGLIVFFGTSYIWFPGEDVVNAGYRTEGVAHLPAKIWGAYVVASALAMLAVTVLGLRRAKPRAVRAALYEFVFLFLVVIIEPDPVFPVLFAIILGFALWRVHGTSQAARSATVFG